MSKYQITYRSFKAVLLWIYSSMLMEFAVWNPTKTRTPSLTKANIYIKFTRVGTLGLFFGLNFDSWRVDFSLTHGRQ